MKKIKLTESDLYNIIKRVLLEQEEEEQNNRRIFNENQEYFKMLLKNVFRNDSEKLTRVFNKQYDKVIINGGLYLDGTPIQTLPDNLYVGGSLWLGKTSIQSLPDNLYVGGDLGLRDTPIQSLPDNLHVGGYLNLNECKNLKSLGDNLYVEGNLWLNGTPIQSLPDNLRVTKTIYIGRTPLNDNQELVAKYEKKYQINRH